MKSDCTNRKWGCIIALFILCAYLLLGLVPCYDLPNQKQIAAAANAYLLITADQKLVGWGSNEEKLIGNGILPYYPYLARKVILNDVVAVSSNDFNCAMAVDENGVLWGWGTRSGLIFANEEPSVNHAVQPYGAVKIMEGVSDVGVGYDHAIVLKQDGTVWMWGSRETMPPQKVMDDCIRVFAYRKQVFAIDAQHDLYLIDGEAIKIAGAIQDISMLNWKEYLLLTEHGAVYVLHTSPDRPGEGCAVVEAEPVADGVAALYGYCMVKEDGTYCVFEHGTVSETDILTLNSLSIAKSGKIISNGMLGTASLRLVSPEYRNAGLTIGIICFVLLRRKSRG